MPNTGPDHHSEGACYRYLRMQIWWSVTKVDKGLKIAVAAAT